MSVYRFQQVYTLQQMRGSEIEIRNERPLAEDGHTQKFKAWFFNQLWLIWSDK